MEFRVFPQPRREPPQDDRQPAFGRRQTPLESVARYSKRRVVEAAALGIGAAVLAYLVIETF